MVTFAYSSPLNLFYKEHNFQEMKHQASFKILRFLRSLLYDLFSFSKRFLVFCNHYDKNKHERLLLYIVVWNIFFWRARVCRPLLRLCRLFMSFEGYLDSNPECCRSKLARYGLEYIHKVFRRKISNIFCFNVYSQPR